MAEDKCPICLMPFTDGNAPEHLPCGHLCHAACLHAFASSTQTPREELKCPHCRMSPVEVDSAMQKLMEEPTISNWRNAFPAPLGDGPARPISLTSIQDNYVSGDPAPGAGEGSPESTGGPPAGLFSGSSQQWPNPVESPIDLVTQADPAGESAPPSRG